MPMAYLNCAAIRKRQISFVLWLFMFWGEAGIASEQFPYDTSTNENDHHSPNLRQPSDSTSTTQTKASVNIRGMYDSSNVHLMYQTRKCKVLCNSLTDCPCMPFMEGEPICSLTRNIFTNNKVDSEKKFTDRSANLCHQRALLLFTRLQRDKCVNSEDETENASGKHLHLLRFNTSTTLYQACDRGNMDTVRYIISRKLEDINHQGTNGRTPVMAAARKGHSEVFAYLVSQGCDLSLRDQNNDSVVHMACFGGSTDIVRKLIKELNHDMDEVGGFGMTPVMGAVVNGQREVVEFLVDEGCYVPVADKNGNNILHIACQMGHKDIVEYIVKKKLVNIDSRGICDRTAVMIAAEHGHKEIVKLLIREGCDPTVVDKYSHTIFHRVCISDKVDIAKYLIVQNIVHTERKYRLGQTPLMIAAWFGSTRVFDLLVVKGCSLGALDFVGNNILHIACMGGHVDMVKHIINHYNVDIECKGFVRRTPLLTAAGTAHKAIFDFLVKKGCNVEAVDEEQNGILHLACMGGHVVMVKHIIEHYNVDIECKGFVRRTPLLTAAGTAHKAIFDFLVRKGCNVEAVDEEQNGILHLACMGGHVVMVKHIIEHYNVDIECKGFVRRTPLLTAAGTAHKAIFDFLVRKGCNVEAVDEEQNGILHLACMGGHVVMVKHIIEHYNVDIECKGLVGRTPLLTAAGTTHKEIFDFLVKKGCNVEAVDEDKNGILHLACMGGHLVMVKHIIKHYNVDIECKGFDGRTPLLISAGMGHNAIFDFLAKKGCNKKAVDNENSNILLLVCGSGNVRLTRYIIRNHLFDIDCRDAFGATPVLRAAHFGHTGVVKFLKGEGCNMMAINANGNNIMHMACFSGKADLVRYLIRLRVVSVNERNKRGVTALDLAKALKYSQLVDIMAGN